MSNVKTIIEGNNKKILRNSENPITEKKCSCPKNAACPLDGECLASDIVYCTTVTCGSKVETYVGLTSTSFKLRYANHKASFNVESKRNYLNMTKQCNLCIAEKFFILCKLENATLNKRNELVNVDTKINFY